MFGVRTATSHGSGNGWNLEVEYVSVSRAGMDAALGITVTKQGGFDDDVVLALSSSYLEILDIGGVSPEPTSSVTDGDRIIWTFDAPPGDVLVVSVDAHVTPARLTGRRARLELLDANAVATQVSFSTRLMP